MSLRFTNCLGYLASIAGIVMVFVLTGGAVWVSLVGLLLVAIGIVLSLHGARSRVLDGGRREDEGQAAALVR